MKSPRGPNSARILISVTPELKAELEAEAERARRTLSDYIRNLLQFERMKWARKLMQGESR